MDEVQTVLAVEGEAEVMSLAAALLPAAPRALVAAPRVLVAAAAVVGLIVQQCDDSIRVGG